MKYVFNLHNLQMVCLKIKLYISNCYPLEVVGRNGKTNGNDN